MRGRVASDPYVAMVIGASAVPFHPASRAVPVHVQPRLKSNESPGFNAASFARPTVFHAADSDAPLAPSAPFAQST